MRTATLHERAVHIPADSVTLEGTLSLPEGAKAVVIFAHGSGPGNKLVSSRSAAGSNPSCVMRPFDTSVSPVASISILTCVNAPQALDAFRPSYAQGSTKIYLSRNLGRQLLPKLPAVQAVAIIDTLHIRAADEVPDYPIPLMRD